MLLTTRPRTTGKRRGKRKGKARANRVGIPLDPLEYEARRIHAQRAVDRYHGPGRYRVVGEPGEMLDLVSWVDYPLLAQPPHTGARVLATVKQLRETSHAA